MTDIDAKSELAALNAEMVQGRSIKEIEKTWDRFYRVRSVFEFYHGGDKHAMKLIEDLNRGLGQFTHDMRENMPSPFEGFRVTIFALQRYLQGGFGEDGWPRKPDRSS